MANAWELVDTGEGTCDYCGNTKYCNIYQKTINADQRIVRFFWVCGSCLTAWLKSTAQFKSIDYGN